MFKLTELAEKRIGEYIKKYKGGILYDSWACNSTHCLGVFESYMRRAINFVTLELQKHDATLSDCRYAFDTLLEVFGAGQKDEQSVFYGCKLRDDYILQVSFIATDDVFETGFIKIQRNSVETMAAEETEACRTLQLANPHRQKCSIIPR